MEEKMSYPRIPANFNWDFKKAIQMTKEEEDEMFNQDPELNAMINQNNVQQGERDDDNQSNQDVENEDGVWEEFNYNGKLGNNHNGPEGNGAGNDLL
jgi:hypothetical protein